MGDPEMARSLDDLLKTRPGNRRRQDAHAKRMRAEVQAYRLREIREMQELTQVELAEELEVSQKRVSEIECGDIDRTKVDTLRRYAAALGGTLRIEVCIDKDTYEIA